MQNFYHRFVAHKFGGSSLRDAERFVASSKLLSGKEEIIIVSAMQGITNTLQKLLDAAKSRLVWQPLFNQLENQHQQAIQSLSLQDKVFLQTDFELLANILNEIEVSGGYSREIQDYILGFGELWSAKILKNYLKKFNKVLYLDASTILFMFEKKGFVCIDWDKSVNALTDFLEDKQFDQLVITGFVASTLDGKRTNLGRNSSDFSAAIFAKLFRAKKLIIWTDVDGIYTADPSMVPSAHAIEYLSYHQAMEIAYFGAQVLHPMTIAPVNELKIPVWIKNSFNPSAKGTCISVSSASDMISIGVIGPGQVGKTLLAQIHSTLKKFNYHANFHIRGIMDSKKMLLSHDAIDLASWEKNFSEANVKADRAVFIDHISNNDLPHAVIIDCTANADIASEYAGYIKKGIHIITPNKHANAGDLDYYHQLKSLTRKKDNHYFYEATVCAGLPVITTLQDILKTGDKVIRIEGIVSGTLSYIFNEMAKKRKFSEIVREARELGYTEPDPREDLSGMDVARKTVCLAREIGFDVHLHDVNVHNLVPDKLKSCSVNEFLDQLDEYDAEMEKLVEEANSNQEKICYVSSIDEHGDLQVKMSAYANHHPFSRLHGTDNMLIFHTKRYHQQPLVIQGPGAGAEVTAAGIFADLLRLASLLPGRIS